ncbi:CHAT domain-containing protein [Roseivirga sp. BDSF3-8]|uniref:CHAT domain-containing protein n=1 Tax=Roseivirga sp. BDSF3-8 TaxID=3241598 RepID=UPI00353274CA
MTDSVLFNAMIIMEDESAQKAFNFLTEKLPLSSKNEGIKQALTIARAGTLSDSPEQVITLLGPTLSDTETHIWWRAKGHLLLAEAYLRLGRAEEAKPQFSKAKKLSETASAPAITAYAYVGLAVCAYYQQDIPAMERALVTARSLATDNLPPPHEIFTTCDQLLGVLYQVTGDYDKALDVSLRVLKRAEAAEQDELLPYYVNTGAIYLEKGEYAYAVSYFRQGLARDTVAGLSVTATAYNNMGLALRRLGKVQEAVSSLKKSIRHYSKANKQTDKRKLADAYNNLTACYLQLEHFDSAAQVITEARTHLPGIWEDDPLSWHTQGVIQLKNRQYTDSKGSLLQSLALHKQKFGKGHPYQATIYTDLARLFNRCGDPEKALSLADSAIMIALPAINKEAVSPGRQGLSQVAGWHALRQKAQILMALAESDDQYTHQALQICNQAIALLDQIRQNLATDESGVAWSQAAHPVLETGIQTARRKYEQTGDDNFIKNALAFAEKNKSVKLLETTLEAIAALDNDYLDTLLFYEEKVNSQMALFRRKLARETARDKQNVWQEKIFRLQQARDSLMPLLREATPVYYRQRYTTEVLDTDSIRKHLLGPEDLFVEYFIGIDQTWGIWLSATEEGIFSVGHPDTLQSAISQYLQIISRPPAMRREEAAAQSAAYISHSHRLFLKLMGPLVEKLKASSGRLVIVPDGSLNFLPFESLITSLPTTDKESLYRNLPYLLRSHTVSYAYSASLLLTPAADGANYAQKGIGIYAPFVRNSTQRGGNTTLDCNQGRLYALACSDTESDKILQMASGDLFQGLEATRTTFQELAPYYSILHLATHACLDPHDPALNRIYLADDYITTSELYGTRLNAQLAVLSACNTGSGEFIAGEGVMSLGRGLAYAGVPSLVTSLWPVDDCATSDLMVKFYEELMGQNTLPKDKALQAAKLRQIQMGEDIMAHPYYWAAFTHTGKWAPLDTSLTHTGTGLWLYVMWIGLITAVGGLLFFIIKRKFT